LPFGTTEGEGNTLFKNMVHTLDHVDVARIGSLMEVRVVETPPSTKD